MCAKISIPVAWGNIAGKWWGRTDVRPILCVHGWMDNAGSFDRLVPLLPKHIGYLAIDLPGHGLSSWLPRGASYNFPDMVYLFKIIKNIYNWDKISILGHSIGSAMSFIYTGIYPEDVDMIIALDTLQLPDKSPDIILKCLHANSENNIKAINRFRNGSKLPNYTYDEMIDRLIKGGSITRETAPYLLERGSVKSETHPNKYNFTHDNRAKAGAIRMIDTKVFQEIAKRVKCPLLFYKANRFNPEAEYYDQTKSIKEVLKIFCESNPNYESHSAKGAHHFHLTNVEEIKDTIANFINKHRPLKSEIN